MLERENLRKADVFSGIAFVGFGLWMIRQAFRMPMKDSWGGVMNVWYVSPALMPIFIGCMILLLGSMLLGIALREIGFRTFLNTLKALAAPEMLQLLKNDAAVRFYAIVVLLVSLVYVHIPRIDFFLCAILFLAAFILMFYLDEDRLLRRLLCFYLAGEIVVLSYFGTGFHAAAEAAFPFAADLLVFLFFLAFGCHVWRNVRFQDHRLRQFRIGLIVSVATPLVIGSIFKYFLMVPLPKEGIVVAILDYLWYLEFL